MVLVHRANVTREAESEASARFTIPAKTEPTARQSSYFVRSAFVGLCHDKNNVNSDFNVNIYIEKYVKLKIQILNE